MQMRKSVTQALVDIKESAERAKAIAAGSLPNCNNKTYEPFINASGDDASLRTFQFDPLLSSTRSPVDEPVTTELDELLSSIQASVDRLFRLSMLIRRSRPQGRRPTDTGAPVADPSMDIRHVKDKFPKVKDSEWLAERLGIAIAKQRAFVCYRQLHHQRLAEQSQGSAEDGKARSRRAPSTIATTYDEGSIDIEQQADENRRHVFTDLQPYVCTFEDCSSGSFSSRHEWFNHELESHRKQWHCAKCHSRKFTSASSLRDHFDSVHPGSFTNAQWPLILKACERPLRKFGSSSCPLCFSWDQPESKAYNAEEFCRHFGSHLQQLALTALPIAIEGLVVLEDEDGDAISDASGNEENAGENHDSDVPGRYSGPHVLSVMISLVEFDKESNVFVFLVGVAFDSGELWELNRIYDDFYDLHINLLTQFPREAGNLGGKRTLPYMPGPVSHVTEAISEGRKADLEAYLCNLVNQPTHISQSSLVAGFFTPRAGDQSLAVGEYYE